MPPASPKSSPQYGSERSGQIRARKQQNEKYGSPPTATEDQVNANRQNAKKSTGPRTAEGKAASSRNGLKHGLCANKHILLDEDPEEFLFLLQDLLRSEEHTSELQSLRHLVCRLLL